ncbi:flagellar hook capping FlgD N-terminal domain-containing protein [Sporolactobacillus sp. THM19-2]|uniref:flagellar hook capping FlgD N-terminal domain-containing protein n=1 Tax=Sporolactobacillus sp. THM19-2 TaxID=2511171 RepID=UPI001F0D08DE|nr:flagellar hook capping FlgD N-terminal domain-containing protein [Sporolactobacillus sp. THM19-2]
MVSPINSMNTVASDQVAGRKNDTLSKDDFLKLFVAQLTHQDPTSPLDSGQFISQMAEFTSLEQTQNMGQAIDKFVDSQSSQSLSDQAVMIGKRVAWEEDDDSGQTHLENGIISSVTLKDGAVYYVTQTGESVHPSSVTEISEPEDAGVSES